jgi:hypothetical protein
LSVVHIVMSTYMFMVMQKPFNVDEPTDRNLNARVQQMLCYDPWFALYIIIAIFQVIDHWFAVEIPICGALSPHSKPS